jgi:PAS domain S-box-containing protein
VDERQPAWGRSAAADVLRREREEILRAWEERIRALPAARRLPGPALRDFLPRLLEAVAAMLDCGADPRTSLGALPDTHALERLAEGYEVSAAAAEIAALRAVVLERLAAVPAAASEDLRPLHAALDHMIVRSVDRFTRARERTLRALDKVSSAALGSADVDQFLPRLLEGLLETSPAADTAYVMLRDGDVLRVRAAAGPGSELSRGFSVRLGEGFAGAVAVGREPMLVHDAASDPLVLNPALKGQGFRALYGVPLLHADQVIGVAEMASRSASDFSEEDQQLFRTAAQRAATLVVQAQLVSSRARAIEALEHGPGLLVVDPDWRIVLVNTTEEQIFGLRRADALGRVLWDASPVAADPGGAIGRELRRCMAERAPVVLVEYLAEPALWCEITGYPSRDGGIVVFFRDVTEQKKIEQTLDRRRWELDELLANTTALVCVAGLDGRLRRVNAALVALLGYPEAELLATPFLDFVHPRDRTSAVRELDRLATGARTVHFEVRLRRNDGSWRWTAWNSSPDRERQLVFAVGRDVTDEKARADFERDLVGIVSHDLRNPLHAILLSASTLLGRKEADERVVRVADRIQSAADRSIRLVGELLDFTRARVGRGIPLAPRPADLHAIAREVVEEVQGAHPDRKIRVESSGPGAGEWDPGRLAQALTNLVVNALTYSPPDAVVSMTTRGDGEVVSAEVHNRGPPIPREVLPRIFQPYHRGGSENGGSSSLGLGLFIAREIARGHGGSIEVRSSEEEGTTFTLRLPRAGRRRGGG